MTEMVAALQARCEQHQEKWNYLLTIFFKDPALLADVALQQRLRERGWRVERCDTNPHLASAAAPAAAAAQPEPLPLAA